MTSPYFEVAAICIVLDHLKHAHRQANTVEWCLPHLENSSKHFVYINAGNPKNHTSNFRSYYFHFVVGNKDVKQLIRDNIANKW